MRVHQPRLMRTSTVARAQANLEPRFKVTESKEPYPLKVEGQRFKVGPGQLGNVLGASLPLILRVGSGITVAGYSPGLADADESQYALTKVGGRQLAETSKVLPSCNRPAQPIILYEFDPCPFCKKVREMVTYLDVDVLFLPTPQGGPNFRPEAIEKGGKSMFPYMEDPNTGTAMYESDDIIKYLSNTYGNGSVPLQLRLGPLTILTAGLSGIPRLGKGGRYKPSRMPEQPLVLWGYEPSPFTRLVKEKLCEMEIPHIYKSTARGSAKRQQMFEKYGKFQAPLLEDPNEKVAMFESYEIMDYLDRTYSVPA